MKQPSTILGTAIISVIMLAAVGCGEASNPEIQKVNLAAHKFLVAQYNQQAGQVCSLSMPKAWWWDRGKTTQANCVRSFKEEYLKSPQGGITGEGPGDFEAIGHKAKTTVQGNKAQISFPTECANQPMKLEKAGGRWMISQVQHYYCTGLIQAGSEKQTS